MVLFLPWVMTITARIVKVYTNYRERRKFSVSVIVIFWEFKSLPKVCHMSGIWIAQAFFFAWRCDNSQRWKERANCNGIPALTTECNVWRIIPFLQHVSKWVFSHKNVDNLERILLPNKRSLYWLRVPPGRLLLWHHRGHLSLSRSNYLSRGWWFKNSCFNYWLSWYPCRFS